MNYLTTTVQEMKEEILTIHKYLKNARNQREAGIQIDKLEKLLISKLLQSFRNGIEIGSKKQGSRKSKR